ncbi:MAG: fructose-bisphosphate aldolase [Chloroflexi bacterium]|nr:fructose-bisphosphate aldolase [Chloroflexota bacterium]
MDSGKLHRLKRIFRTDGKTLIVAMDHGTALGVVPGLERPGDTIKRVLAGGADAIMANFGIATAFAAEIGQAGLILRVDRVAGGDAGEARLLYRAEDALRIGADCIACMGFPGSRFEHATLRHLAELAAECQRWQLPLLAEMLPQGFEGGEDARKPQAIGHAIRIGAELGADIVKTQYSGTVAGFRSALVSCFVPVVVLGGGKMEDEADVLRTAREAVDAGATGVAMGRNIWSHQHPERMTAALAAIIHDGATVEQAMKKLR